MMSQSVKITPAISTPEVKSSKSTKTPIIQHKMKRRILLFGLALSTVCALFPVTLLGPALGLIALDLNDNENMSWYMNAFYLGSAIFQLLSIKISDCFGRRRLYLFSISFMSVSCLVSGFSVNSYMLIVMRVSQGICCGILQTLSIAVIIDLFPLEKRILYLSNNSVAYGITSTVGPMIGGIISDKLSWRYIFAINLIIAIPVSIIIYLYVEIPTRPEQRISVENCKTICSRVDAGGCMIVTVSIVCLLLGMNYGSTSKQYDWSSPLVIGLLAGSFVSAILLVIYERYIASVPLFPSALVTNRNMVLVYIQQFMNGCYFLLITTMASITFQSVFNDTPTKGSLKIIPVTVTFSIFTVIQARITKKLRTPKPSLIFGNIIMMPILLVMTFSESENSNTGIQIGMLVLYVVGFGFVNQATNIGSQLILEKEAPHMVAASAAIIRFLIQFGMAVMSSIFFSVMNTQVSTHLTSLHETDPSLYQKVIASGAYRDYVKISSISDKQVQTTLNAIYFQSISKVYYVLIAICALANVCMLLVRIPKMPENKSKETEPANS